jgi:hypothetical protein
MVTTAPVPVEMVEWLRRLTGETGSGSVYSDGMLAEMIGRYAMVDAEGYAPVEVGWAGAWDVHLAAADVWEEKAAAVAADFDFAADGGDYKRSQAYGQMVRQAQRMRAMRRSSTLVMVAEPKPAGAVRADGWIGNGPANEGVR